MCALTPNNPLFQPGFEDADTSITAAIGLYGYYGPAPTSKLASAPSDYLCRDAAPFFAIHGSHDPMVSPAITRFRGRTLTHLDKPRAVRGTAGRPAQLRSLRVDPLYRSSRRHGNIRLTSPHHRSSPRFLSFRTARDPTRRNGSDATADRTAATARLLAPAQHGRTNIIPADRRSPRRDPLLDDGCSWIHIARSDWCNPSMLTPHRTTHARLCEDADASFNLSLPKVCLRRSTVDHTRPSTSLDSHRRLILDPTACARCVYACVGRRDRKRCSPNFTRQRVQTSTPPHATTRPRVTRPPPHLHHRDRHRGAAR